MDRLMRYLRVSISCFAIAILALLQMSCGSTKPWIKAADMQPNERRMVVNVFYDDFDLNSVKTTLEAASEDFFQRTNFHIVAANYYSIHWQSKNLQKMTLQATAEWERLGRPGCHWYIFVYKRNLATKIVAPLFFVFGIWLPSNWSSTGECGNTMIVDNLTHKIWVHEMYHLGWGWKIQCDSTSDM